MFIVQDWIPHPVVRRQQIFIAQHSAQEHGDRNFSSVTNRNAAHSIHQNYVSPSVSYGFVVASVCAQVLQFPLAHVRLLYIIRYNPSPSAA